MGWLLEFRYPNRYDSEVPDHPDPLAELVAERATLNDRIAVDARARTAANYRHRDRLDDRIAALKANGTHTCQAPGCDATFAPRRADQVYCSNACRQRAWRNRELAPIACHAIGCGREFTPVRPTNVYCSAACKQRAYRAARGANTRTRVRFDDQT